MDDVGLGIINLQASCYLSAFLSCLLGGCLKWLHVLYTAPTPFIQALQADVKARVMRGHDVLITPQHTLVWYQRVAAAAFRDGRGGRHITQDPNELLMFMLDEFDVKKNPRAGAIAASYALVMSAELTCSQCHHHLHVAPQPCAALNMPMRSTWQESLEVALQIETLTDYHCVKCYVHSQPDCKFNTFNEKLDPEARAKKEPCQKCADPTTQNPPMIKKPILHDWPTTILIINILRTMPGQRMTGIELTLLQHYDLAAFSIWTGSHHYACWRQGDMWYVTNDSQCTHGLTTQTIQHDYLPQAHQLFYMHKDA